MVGLHLHVTGRLLLLCDKLSFLRAVFTLPASVPSHQHGSEKETNLVETMWSEALPQGWDCVHGPCARRLDGSCEVRSPASECVDWRSCQHTGLIIQKIGAKNVTKER